jgi:hypothetical protein
MIVTSKILFRPEYLGEKVTEEQVRKFLDQMPEQMDYEHGIIYMDFATSDYDTMQRLADYMLYKEFEEYVRIFKLKETTDEESP